ncbi:energy-coupling factor transporter transmembrane component T family protein [Romboutsia lituseburensis]|uniref:energy-coupling factor transporter transmembrane component T family protein n=1 Tax=Romboutsia lituseburensis TaxID=1537 RepID=UPI00215AC3F0|nr:energy-coupling factor transporter transmembrane protein EcfT [Romboutsia lituseburensis]MCR8746652.1 energy-coupling factor transporter transmembrane protein EcfT [Romboutsia lituseburensis]
MKAMEFDFRTKLIVLILNTYVVSMISRESLFSSLILLLSVYLIIQGKTKSLIKCLVLYAILIILKLISNGEGITILLPEMFLFLVIRMIAIIMAAIPILGMPPGEIVAVIKKLKIPNYIGLPFIFMIRFFPTVKIEFKEVFESIRLRKLVSIKEPLKALEYTFIPVMIRSTRIAEELAAASESRGISSPGIHTSRRKIKLCIKDYTLILIALIVFIALFILEKGY